MKGTQLSHYEILDTIGRGGMGEVYRARDTKLRRDVAIKVLRPELVSDPQRRARFLREARAAAAVTHRNIVTIHEIDEHDGTVFIVMELVEGETLRSRLAKGQLSTSEALRLASGITDGLTEAHDGGVVHRDLKPENVVIAKDGTPRILDFGLAKSLETDAVDQDHPSRNETATLQLTQEGTVMGTAAYMSPEQAEGRIVDSRSDVFSSGIVLYEMLAGRRPFEGESRASTISAILRDEAPPLKRKGLDVPKDVQTVVDRCLEKDPNRRYDSARSLAADLHECRSRMETSPAGAGASLRKPAVAIPIAVLVIAVVALGVRLWTKQSQDKWLQETALPKINELRGANDFYAAWTLAVETAERAPDDPQVQHLIKELVRPIKITTEPPGADVYVRGYRGDPPWHFVGTTPIERTQLPLGWLRFRVEKSGFATVERCDTAGGEVSIQLPADETVPDGMVFVPGGRQRLRMTEPVELADYWVDRYEVTNAQYQQFVGSDGYQNRDYWQHSFVKNETELPWESAMELFVDSTGRPGPATWELGSYQTEMQDHPVSGISWYEAAAYARFVDKQLPSVFHWDRIAGENIFSDILAASNLTDGIAIAPVGSFQGIGSYGTYDLAGNVREWCINSVNDLRYILGGAWGDPHYQYKDLDAADPFDRSPKNGLRCIKSTASLAEEITGPVAQTLRDFNHEPIATDEVFAVYKSMYAYDPVDLDERIESFDDSSPYWRREIVSYRAAYGNERVLAHVFLPKDTSPPYQVVLAFPGGGAFYLESSDDMSLAFFDFVARTGRALVHPVYNGSFERQVEPSSGPQARRARIIEWSQDVSRTVDYLETREDLDHERLAFIGLSLGAEYAPIYTAVDPRFKASVMAAGHLHEHHMRDPPEVQPLHFGPRSTVPVLLINGEYDFMTPVETSLKPMFNLQGAPDADKRLIITQSGHVPPLKVIIKESLDWFDEYLGPVQRESVATNP